jgi:hypothetical protein
VAASVDVEQPVLTAEEIAAAEVDAAAAAAAPAVLSGSSKAELAAQVRYNQLPRHLLSCLHLEP